MKREDVKWLLGIFFSWRFLLFVVLFFAVRFLNLQPNFLGGGLNNYLSEPFLFSWANFDGEHYMAIAQDGYRPLSYSFFPFYPLLIKYLSFWGQGLKDLLVSGLLVSHLSFIVALIGLWKLFKLDYKTKTIKLSLLLLVLFPTSFYFGSVYTESIFLSLVTWSFYFARNRNWFWAVFLAGVSTSVRVVGVAMLPALAIEFVCSQKMLKLPFFAKWWKSVFLLFIPLGILSYMYFLKGETGDPLEFFHNVSIFGEQRTAGFILLPQVFYRYIFKILPALNTNYFPVIFTTYLEFVAGIAFLVLSILSFFRLRLSYSVYLALSFLIPTFSGSFSSLPRYVLISFPAFLLMALYLEKTSKPAKLSILAFSAILLAVATALFVRGYWVS